jgi:hypothetical protein
VAYKRTPEGYGMKCLPHIPFLLFSVFAQGNELGMLTDIASLQWKHRVILVDQPHDRERVVALLRGAEADIEDRDIVWFVSKEGRIWSNYSGGLSEAVFNNARERNRGAHARVILIGKDGGIKSRLDSVDLAAIFSRIDAMPMRRQEMQN